MCGPGGFLAQADEYLEKQAAELTEAAAFRSGEACEIPRLGSHGGSEIIEIYDEQMLRMAGCPLRDVGAVHLEAAAAIAADRWENRSAGRRFSGLERYDAFCGTEEKLAAPVLPKLKFSRFTGKKNGNSKNQYTKWFDYDK